GQAGRQAGRLDRYLQHVIILLPTNLVGINLARMIFSTRSTYGLRAMINLAKHKKFGSVSLAIIAEQENISLKYLERLFAALKKASLVKAEIGAGGGYKLAKSPKQINVYDIIIALEGKLKAFHCTGEEEKVYCNNKCRCGVTGVLVKVEQAINSTLKDIKLSQLLF
ncbi:Rrf2 family transcriptional regulator, partial [Candidatus Falkowbacteria bacterium]|nr:Rrf2 family transcriptional regulator [Candidatus Falkowbacteria bacterium]